MQQGGRGLSILLGNADSIFITPHSLMSVTRAPLIQSIGYHQRSYREYTEREPSALARRAFHVSMFRYCGRAICDSTGIRLNLTLHYYAVPRDMG